MERVIFWNNKGGTGKTTLTFQIILAIDVCP